MPADLVRVLVPVAPSGPASGDRDCWGRRIDTRPCNGHNFVSRYVRLSGPRSRPRSSAVGARACRHFGIRRSWAHRRNRHWLDRRLTHRSERGTNRQSGSGITSQCCGRPRVPSKVFFGYSVLWRVALAATDCHPLAGGGVPHRRRASYRRNPLRVGECALPLRSRAIGRRDALDQTRSVYRVPRERTGATRGCTSMAWKPVLGATITTTVNWLLKASTSRARSTVCGAIGIARAGKRSRRGTSTAKRPPANQTLHWTGATTVLVIRTLVVGPGQ